MCGISLIAGLIYLETEFKKNSIQYRSRDKIIISVIIALLFSIVGARLVDCYFHRDRISSILEGGFTYYGGLITGGLTLLISSAFLELPISKVLNLVTPSLVIGHFFGRIGCFFGGCCYGRPTDSIFGVVFPEGSMASLRYGPDVAVHPTQLYEAVFLLVLFWALVKVIPFTTRTAVYFFSYGSFRFILEFLRGDNRGILIKGIDLYPSQFISVFFVTIGVLMLIKYREGENKTTT
jgi:phosphatidylglycerol:prolipoprotein diacylglycerol transferase